MYTRDGMKTKMLSNIKDLFVIDFSSQDWKEYCITKKKNMEAALSY